MADVSLEGIGTLVGAIVAGAAAGFTAIEYYQRKVWRKSDLASALMGQLDTNRELALTCQALDWAVGPIIVPQQYRPLFARAGLANDAVMDHDPAIMARALEPQLNSETLFEPRGLVYRHCFIKLFNCLDNISRLEMERQIELKGLDGLDYWLARLAKYQYPIFKQMKSPNGDISNVRIESTDVFQPALARFGYPRIPALAKKLGISDWSTFEKHWHKE